MVYSTHSRVRGSSIVVLALIAAACGPAANGNGPTVVPPAEGAPSVSPSSTESKPLPTGDTAAVPAPNSLIVTGRLRSFGELESQLHVSTSSIFGEAFGSAREAFDTGQPVDFAVTASGKGRGLKGAVAFSFPIKNNTLTRTAIEQHDHVTEKDGILYLEDKHGEGDKTRCAVANSFGAATHRMICSSDGSSLDAIAPYLARTLTREEVKNLVSMRVDFRPLHETVHSLRKFADIAIEDRLGRREMELLKPLLGPMLDAYVDYIGDMSTADLAIDAGSADVNASLTFHYESSKSRITKSLLARADRNHPPAQAFLQLPKDTKLAMAHGGIPKESQALLTEYKQAMTSVLGHMPAGGVMAKEKEQITKTLLDLVDLVTADAPGVYAFGNEGGFGSLKYNQKQMWVALEQELPAAKWIAIAKRIQGQKMLHGFVKFGPAPAARNLPAGTFTLDINVPRGPTYALAIVPLSKGRALVAFGGSEAALRRVVDSVAGKEVEFGSLPAIDALKLQPSSSFFAVRANAFDLPGVSDSDFVTMTSTATSSGDGGTGTIKLSAPKSLVSMLFGVLKHMGGGGGGRYAEPKVGPAEPDN